MPGRFAGHRRLADVDAAGFPSADAFTAGQAELDAVGLRDTGSAAHERYVDRLHERLERVGVRGVVSERVAIDRWAARSWRLELEQDEGWLDVPTLACIPYSGATPPTGTSGALVSADDAHASFRDAVGLYDLAPQPTPNRAFERIAYSLFDPCGELDPTSSTDMWRPNQSRAVLRSLQAAGAAAAIGVVGLPHELARIYVPYDGIVRTIPGVYVDRRPASGCESPSRGAAAPVSP